MGDIANGAAAAGRTRGEERQCYICLEVEQTEDEEGRWVSPCRCTGTMAWVHQECLLQWVRELEQHHASPACSQCLTRFVLIPQKGPLLSFLDFFYKRIVPACKYLAGCLFAVIVFDSACTTMGVFALTQVYGIDETIVILMDYEDGFEAVIHLQLISYSLMLISYLPWEQFLLQVLRRLSRLPLLRAVLPADLPVRFLERPRKRSTWLTMTESLLLPVFANVIGTVFFSSVKSPLFRALVGGAVYLTVQGGFSMYLSQKLLVRQQNIRVLPFEEVAETAQVPDE